MVVGLQEDRQADSEAAAGDLAVVVVADWEAVWVTAEDLRTDGVGGGVGGGGADGGSNVTFSTRSGRGLTVWVASPVWTQA